MFIKKGSIKVFSTGEYDLYYVVGLAQVLKTFDIDKEAEKYWRAGADKFYKKHKHLEGYRVYESKFLKYLEKEGLIKIIKYQELDLDNWCGILDADEWEKEYLKGKEK